MNKSNNGTLFSIFMKALPKATPVVEPFVKNTKGIRVLRHIKVGNDTFLFEEDNITPKKLPAFRKVLAKRIMNIDRLNTNRVWLNENESGGTTSLYS